MKFKKIMKCSLAVALVFGTTSALVGCGKDDSTTKNDDKKYEIYKMALDAGATELSYEDWLISIKGAKGEKGDATEVTIGNNGHWFIDGVDTGVSATGTDGEDGTDGTDGTKWTVSDSVPTNSTGKNGDFHLNSENQTIYCKENGVWIEKVTVRDGVDGTNGKQIQLDVTESQIIWKYVDSNTWNNLIAISELKGATGNDGKKVELRVENGNVEWRHEGGTWDTLTSLESIKGEPGKDGTKWLSGTTHPDLASGLNPNEGDFYFDTTNDDIYRYVSNEWVLEVDLENKVEETELVLEDGTYTGFMMGFEFAATVEKGEEYEITELLLNGNPASQMGVTNALISVDGKVISVTVTVSIPGEDPFDTTSKMVLKGDNVLVPYVSVEEKELLKGVYENYNVSTPRLLTLGESNFAFNYDYIHLKGTYEIVYVNADNGIYGLVLTSGNKTVTVLVNYFYRTVELDGVGDFESITYDYNGEDFVYTVGDVSTIKIGNAEPVQVTNVTSFDDEDVNYLHIETENNTYLLEYLSGKAYDVQTQNVRFVGTVYVAPTRIENVTYQLNDGEMTMFDGYVYQTVGGYQVSIDTDDNSIYVSQDMGEDYGMQTVYNGYTSSFVDDGDGNYVASGYGVIVTVTLNSDGTIATLAVEEDSNYNPGGGEQASVQTLSAESIKNSIEYNVDYILDNYYNKPEGYFDTNPAGDENYYTAIANGNIATDSITIEDVTYTTYDNVAISVGNNNFIEKPAIKIENGTLYVSSLILQNKILNSEARELNFTMNGFVYGIEFDEVYTDEAFQDITSQNVLKGETPLVNNGSGYDYVSTNGHDTIRFYLGSDQDLDGSEVAFTSQTITTSQKTERAFGYTTIDKVGSDYYLVLYPYYVNGDYTVEDLNGEELVYTLDYSFVLSNGMSAKYTINLTLKVPAAAVVATPVNDYETLKTAIESGEGDIILTDDIVVSETIVVNRTVTIYLNGYQVSLDDNADGTEIFFNGSNGNLTLNGNTLN